MSAQRVAEITGKRGVDAMIEMDLTANAKLIPTVLRPRGSVFGTATAPEATIPAFFCLINSVRLQFFLVYQLDAQERERAVDGRQSRARTRQARLPHRADIPAHGRRGRA